MARDHLGTDLDRELEDLPQELRWREWMRRIEAVLFASATPVPSEDLARVVGKGVSVELLIDDLIADLEGRIRKDESRAVVTRALVDDSFQNGCRSRD